MISIHVVDNISYAKVEESFKICVHAQQIRDQKFAHVGWNAAQQGSATLLRVMEHAAEIMRKEDDNQRGTARHSADTYGESLDYTTETQMFVKAYETLDRGTPEEALMWIYGAGAWLAGMVDRPRVR